MIVHNIISVVQSGKICLNVQNNGFKKFLKDKVKEKIWDTLYIEAFPLLNGVYSTQEQLKILEFNS